MRMKPCSRCKAVAYCDSDCQTSDWKTHKLLCLPLAQVPRQPVNETKRAAVKASTPSRPAMIEMFERGADIVASVDRRIKMSHNRDADVQTKREISEALKCMHPLAAAGNSEAQQELARAYVLIGKLTEAIEWLQRAALKRQGDDSVKYNLCRLYIRQGDASNDATNYELAAKCAETFSDDTLAQRILLDLRIGAGFLPQSERAQLNAKKKLLMEGSFPTFTLSEKEALCGQGWLAQKRAVDQYRVLPESKDTLQADLFREVTTALKLIEPLAETGNPKAQERLGHCYCQLNDLKAAASWMQKAVDQGSFSAKLHIGFVHFERGDFQAAADIFSDIRASKELEGNEGLRKEIDGHLESLRRNGVVPAASRSSDTRKPLTISDSTSVTDVVLELAKPNASLRVSEAGSRVESDSASRTSITTMYKRGLALFESFQRQMRSGHDERISPELQKEVSEAIQCFRPLAETGDLEAQLRLGVALVRSGSIPEAILWLEKAAEQGSDTAKLQLGLIYMKRGEDSGDAKNLEVSADFLDEMILPDERSKTYLERLRIDFGVLPKGQRTKLVEKRHLLAQGTSPSLTLVEKEALCSQGYACLETYMDRSRKLGIEREASLREITEAIHLIKPLAESGDRRAQERLGFCHFQLRDCANAVAWTKKAADQGCPQAKLNLGTIHLEIGDKQLAANLLYEILQDGKNEMEGHEIKKRISLHLEQLRRRGITPAGAHVSETSQSSDPMTGRRVRLHGLPARTDLNGSCGVVTRAISSAERYEVKFDSGESMCLRLQCIRDERVVEAPTEIEAPNTPVPSTIEVGAGALKLVESSMPPVMDASVKIREADRISAALLGHVSTGKLKWETLNKDLRNDKIRAETILREEVQAGNSIAMHKLAKYLQLGSPSKKRSEEALELLSAAAKLGHLQAREAMAEHFMKLGFSSNSVASHAAFVKAAEFGDPRGMFNAFVFYGNGEHGVPRDVAKAHDMLWASADFGYDRAQVVLAQSLQGSGSYEVAEDLKESEIWARKAATRGSASAAFLLFDLLQSTNQVEALSWLQTSDAAGYPRAHFYLGHAYLIGDYGLAEDPLKSMVLFLKAAKGGIIDAYMYLGELFETGKGAVKQDLPKAADYYRNFVLRGEDRSEVQRAQKRLDKMILEHSAEELKAPPKKQAVSSSTSPSKDMVTEGPKPKSKLALTSGHKSDVDPPAREADVADDSWLDEYAPKPKKGLPPKKNGRR